MPNEFKVSNRDADLLLNPTMHLVQKYVQKVPRSMRRRNLSGNMYGRILMLDGSSVGKVEIFHQKVLQLVRLPHKNTTMAV